MHQGPRDQLTGQKEQDGNQSAEAKHEVKKLLNGFSVAFSEILGAENSSCRRTGHQEHVLHELDLRRQGYRRHFLLRNASQHQGVEGRYHGQHQALERDG